MSKIWGIPSPIRGPETTHFRLLNLTSLTANIFGMKRNKIIGERHWKLQRSSRLSQNFIHFGLQTPKTRDFHFYSPQ